MSVVYLVLGMLTNFFPFLGHGRTADEPRRDPPRLKRVSEFDKNQHLLLGQDKEIEFPS